MRVLITKTRSEDKGGEEESDLKKKYWFCLLIRNKIRVGKTRNIYYKLGGIKEV